MLTAGPVANMNLTRLNSNPGLHEQRQQPARPSGLTDLAPTITAAASRGERLSLVDLHPSPRGRFSLGCDVVGPILAQ